MCHKNNIHEMRGSLICRLEKNKFEILLKTGNEDIFLYQEQFHSCYENRMRKMVEKCKTALFMEINGRISRQIWNIIIPIPQIVQNIHHEITQKENKPRIIK